MLSVDSATDRRPWRVMFQPSSDLVTYDGRHVKEYLPQAQISHVRDALSKCIEDMIHRSSLICAPLGYMRSDYPGKEISPLDPRES
jgi:hypothetical protein